MRKAFEKSDNRDFIQDLSKFNQLFDSIDKDKSGYIDYSEFLLASTNTETSTSEEKLECAFQMLDNDGSGKISTAELKNRLGQSIPEDVYQVLLK
jgi:calcium-dependent protein kinase